MQELIKEFNRENLKPTVFIIIVLLLLAVSAYPQRKFGGKVVEIVDGKTAVIQVPTGGKVTVVLQFIEIPEAEQPLYQTVKEHLRTLILDKTVEFLPRRILIQGSVGQIFLNGVDISQQMLRDGAAWYALPEKSAQDTRESEAYQTMETQAKTEKRGVWSIENIKPSWEFRAEKQVQAQELEKAKMAMAALQKNLEAQSPTTTTTTGATVKPKAKQTLTLDMWSNVNNSSKANESSTGTGLLTGTVPNTGFGYVMTAGNFYNFTGGNSKSKVESRSLYAYSSTESGYIIGFLAESEKYSFIQSNNLTIIADKQKINLGKAYRMFRETPNSVQELLLYRIDAKILSKIAAAKNLEVNIGKFSGKLDDNYQMRIKNLLAVTVN